MATLATRTSTGSVLPVVQIDVLDALDVSTLMRLSEQLEEAVSLDPDRVVVDLSRCAYTDAQAIRVLLDAHAALRARGGRLCLRGAGTDTLRLLSVVGLDDVFALEGGERAMAG